jgi:hypothetical protein
VSAGTQVAFNVAAGRPWNEGVGAAFGMGFANGAIDAFTDHYGDMVVEGRLSAWMAGGAAGAADVGGWRRPGDVDADGRPNKLRDAWDWLRGLPGNEQGSIRLGPAGEDGDGLPPRDIHSRYADGTPVYKEDRPPRLGHPVPDPEATGPHARLRWDTVNNRIYQAREFDAQGRPVRDIDFTTPTKPSGELRPGHPGPPHQHWWVPVDPNNPRAGYKRLRHEPLQSPVEWASRAKQWRDPDTGQLISLRDAQAQRRWLVVDEQPGRVVGIGEAEKLSGIPREYLEGAWEVAQKQRVDAFFRDVNPRLGEVASHTVPKPPGEYASPLWKTNEWGYVRNTETGQILVKVSETEYGGFEASRVYDQATGRIYPEFEGRVVGPDIDPYWWHGSEGRIVQGSDPDIALQAAFGEAMGGRITHGQWTEYPGARGPNGPALGIHRGKFVWLEQREIAAWFAYRRVPYPFSK